MHNLIIVKIKTKWNLKKPLEKDGSVSVLHRNIHSHLHTSPEIVTDIFTQTMQQYNFRHNWDFRIPSVNTVNHGSESMSYLGLKILEVIHLKIIRNQFPWQFQKRNQKVSITILLRGKNISVNESLRKV